MKKLKNLCLIVFCIASLSISAADNGSVNKEPDNKKRESAELNVAVPKPPSNRIYKDKLERDTPRSSLRAFLETARSGDFKKASQYLDFGYAASTGYKYYEIAGYCYNCDGMV